MTTVDGFGTSTDSRIPRSACDGVLRILVHLTRDAELHVFRRNGITVVELHSTPQVKRVSPAVWTLPSLGEPRHDLELGIEPRQIVVDLRRQPHDGRAAAELRIEIVFFRTPECRAQSRSFDEGRPALRRAITTLAITTCRFSMATSRSEGAAYCIPTGYQNQQTGFIPRFAAREAISPMTMS